MAQTLFQTLGGGSGGGGAASINYYFPNGINDTPCGSEVNNAGLETLVFDEDDTTTAIASFTLPSSYTSGTQILLKKGKAFSTTNSGNFLVRTIAYIFKANVDGSVAPIGYTSTNIQQAINSTSEEIVVVSDLDLTNSSGQINSVAVAAGDTIMVKLQRLPGSETSGLADTLRIIKTSFELVLS